MLRQEEPIVSIEEVTTVNIVEWSDIETEPDEENIEEMHEADRPVVMNDEYGADELESLLTWPSICAGSYSRY